MKQLLHLEVPSELREQLVEKLTWPRQDPGNEGALNTPKDALLNAFADACSMKMDWTKILNCKPNKGDSPADYLYRLKDVFER